MAFCKIGSDATGNDINLFFNDYGNGPAVILIHGWPLSHRMWEKQITALVDAGFRVIAYDRRGFGMSSQPWDGYDYDTFADDLNALITHTGVDKAALVGFSMGGGEVARYIGKYGTQKVSKAVLMSAVTPFLAKADDNPEGVDHDVFQGMLDGLNADRPGFLNSFVKMFYNWKDGGDNLLSEAAVQYDWQIAVGASPKGTTDCVTAFSGTDFRADLAKFDVPTLVMHGDVDGIVPFEVSGAKAHELVPESELVMIDGGPHGITATHAEAVNKGLIAFLKA